MTRTLDEIAAFPRVGDVVTMRDGHVRYEVVALGAAGLLTTRTSVRIPDRPDERLAVFIDGAGWRDLVFYGASS